MYMVGRAPSQASPSIIICCDVLWHRRHIRQIVKESGILDDFPPGIKTGHMRRPLGFDQLVLLGVRDQSLYNSGEMMALTPHARSACGSQIFVNTHGTNWVSLSAVATIGGVIRLGKKYYYTTAAHAILSAGNSIAGDEECPADDDHDSALSLDGTEDICITSASNLNTDDLSIWHSAGRASEHSDENRYLRDDIVRQWSLKRHHEAEEPLFPLADPGKLSLHPTGKPFITSIDVGSQATELDYALIEMTSRHHNVENMIKFGLRHETVVKVNSFVRSESRDTDIVAITSRGTIKGRISGTPVYSSAPGQCAYRRMFKVSLGSPLQRGDCGTWVVDATDGHLFGHVVLGSPGGDTALLIPFADVFDDILSRTGSSPIFPGARNDDSSTSAETRTPPTARDQALARIIRETIFPMGEIQEFASSKDNADDKTPSREATSLQSRAPIVEGFSDLPKAKEDSEVLAKTKEQSREHLEPSSKGNSSLPGDATRRKSSGMLVQNAPRRNHVPLREKPLDPPVPLRDPKLRHVLMTFSKAPLRWEDTGLLDHALKEINLNAIYSEAEEESESFISRARSEGDTKPQWGYSDCVIRALSRYFRQSFFTRIKKPSCEACPAKLPTIPRGNARPTQEEKAGKAQVVELYQCAEKHCQAYTRFPRYWDPRALLRNPRGRAGEGANCFGMLCRALGSRVRWVWNAEDGVWTEVYSEHQGRWVHVDACEGAWDDPLMYTETMGKKLSYCIAFSVDGATDVTRRYVRSTSHASPRTQCPEEELLSIIHDIKTMRRRDMSKVDLTRLEKEDTAEDQEMVSYLAPSNAVGTAGPSQPTDTKPDSTMMLGPSGMEKDEDLPLTSATSYPGQEWNPFRGAWIEDDL
jgi:peptide-N4-(N-acetyl-beta-glucosaminyl)asparagine amidase